MLVKTYDIDYDWLFSLYLMPRMGLILFKHWLLYEECIPASPPYFYHIRLYFAVSQTWLGIIHLVE